MGGFIAQILLTDENPSGYLTINDLEIAVYVAHLHNFAPLMDPLENISTRVENMVAQVWANQGSFISSTSFGPLLRETAWIGRKTKTHFSVSLIVRTDNKEAYTASYLTHIPVSFFLRHSNSYFPQPNTWQLYLFPSSVNHHVCTMLYTKRPIHGCPLPLSEGTTRRFNSGKPIANGCASPPTSK